MKQIAFTVDRNGKPLAYRVSVRQMRHFRISVDEAKVLIATGAAIEVPFRPFGGSR